MSSVMSDRLLLRSVRTSHKVCLVPRYDPVADSIFSDGDASPPPSSSRAVESTDSVAVGEGCLDLESSKSSNALLFERWEAGRGVGGGMEGINYTCYENL